MVEIDHAVAVYQTVRETISGFDALLVSLLTQGNTFVIGVLAIPLVANLSGLRAGMICFGALALSLFFLLANLLYWSLLRRSVQLAGEFECNELKQLGSHFHITEQLNQLPFSAERGSFFLYSLLPGLLVGGSVTEGAFYFCQLSPIWCGAFVLTALLVVVGSVAVYGVYPRRAV
jgi:hypothetical protein